MIARIWDHRDVPYVGRRIPPGKGEFMAVRMRGGSAELYWVKPLASDSGNLTVHIQRPASASDAEGLFSHSDAIKG
jgi:hypothetical protein